MRDLNVAPCRQDDRCIEVIANGLPLWGGVQVAVDSTLVSPLTAAGKPRREGRRAAGAALRHACRAKERTHPEICNSGRCRLVVLGIETGGRWCPDAVASIRFLARCRARSAPHRCRVDAYLLTCFGGPPCSPSALPAPSRPASFPCCFPVQRWSTEILRSSVTTWPKEPQRQQKKYPRACTATLNDIDTHAVNIIIISIIIIIDDTGTDTLIPAVNSRKECESVEMC